MTYWLARSGEDAPEGPYTQAQLRQRYEAGEADVHDQVCLAGTQAWQDLGRLLDLRAWREAQAPQAVAAAAAPVLTKKKRQVLGNAGCVIFVFGLLMLLFLPPIGVLMIVAALIVEQVSVKMVCCNCGNVTVKTARECAVCRAHFKN